MLVLSRKPGEAIRIGDDIEISVIEVRGDTVRIGIEAPKSVAIFRQELLAEIALTNVESAHAAQEAMNELNTLLRAAADPKKKTQNGGLSR